MTDEVRDVWRTFVVYPEKKGSQVLLQVPISQLPTQAPAGETKSYPKGRPDGRRAPRPAWLEPVPTRELPEHPRVTNSSKLRTETSTYTQMAVTGSTSPGPVWLPQGCFFPLWLFFTRRH
jgi:hypothetical protein